MKRTAAIPESKPTIGLIVPKDQKAASPNRLRPETTQKAPARRWIPTDTINENNGYSRHPPSRDRTAPKRRDETQADQGRQKEGPTREGLIRKSLSLADVKKRGKEPKKP